MRDTGYGIGGPRILTDMDPDLLAVYDDLDEYLEHENCNCDGTCGCQEETQDGSE